MKRTWTKNARTECYQRALDSLPGDPTDTLTLEYPNRKLGDNMEAGGVLVCWHCEESMEVGGMATERHVREFFESHRRCTRLDDDWEWDAW